METTFELVFHWHHFMSRCLYHFPTPFSRVFLIYLLRRGYSWCFHIASIHTGSVKSCVTVVLGTRKSCDKRCI
jgi:hypothetical protein